MILRYHCHVLYGTVETLRDLMRFGSWFEKKKYIYIYIYIYIFFFSVHKLNIRK